MWYLLTAAGWSGAYRSRQDALDAGEPLGFTIARFFNTPPGALP